MKLHAQTHHLKNYYICKNNKNVKHNPEQNKSIKKVPKINRMLELSKKDFENEVYMYSQI